MRKDFFKTLFSRMLSTYLAVILCLLLLMGITVSNMFKNQYLQEEEQSLRRETEKINTILIEKYVYKEKRGVAEEELKTVARKYDALIHVIDSSGNLAAFYDEVESEEKWGTLLETPTRTEGSDPVAVTLSGLTIWPGESAVKLPRTGVWNFSSGANTALTGEGVLLNNLFSGMTDMSTMTLLRAVVKEDGTPDGVIMMHLDVSAVNASITKVYLDVLLTGLMAVAAAVLAVYYLTTRMTKPITDMNATVRRYSKGEFEIRLDDSGSDEVAQLAKSFNVMANELNDLEQMRRSLVANVSHELRSPLTSISGFLEAIQDGTIPPEKRGEYLDLVIAETRRMTAMVNNLLDLARMDSGQSALKLTRFDINELALRTLVTFEARVSQKKLDVELRLHKPNLFVEADADQIAQVLRNLIDNAIKFSPEGKGLEIGTKLIDRRIAQIWVQDQGCGIPEEDVPHVFERFYKVEKAHTPSAQSGTGLGLSIVRSIIDQHGQDIWVESKPGAGTRFTFTLKHSVTPNKARHV
ncbi:MAG TPA: HAMP domain-containing sensor histidine kinase [Feifaniaceae bacterium]|nr:HAMP domain-containing sensor histidine kinase [Feifaniaceae bacterium]